MDVRPEPTDLRPFARSTIEAGTSVGDSQVEMREVPAGLLQEVHLPGMAKADIPEGHPILPSLLTDRPGLPEGWWAIEMPLPGGLEVNSELRLVIETAGEVRDALAELVETLGSGGSWLEMAREIRVEHRITLRGHLYWDLQAGRADSLELSGPSETKLEISLDLGESSGLDAEWRLVSELRGETTIEVETGEPD